VPFYLLGQVVGAIIGAAIVVGIANGATAVSAVAEASRFASNGFGAHSPGGFSLPVVILGEIVFTAPAVGLPRLSTARRRYRRPHLETPRTPRTHPDNHTTVE
jgi:aquaporin Z